MDKAIEVHVEFEQGFAARIEGKFSIYLDKNPNDSSHEKQGLKRVSDFISYAFKDDHNRSVMVTITEKGNFSNSIRFTHEEWNNGYQKRPFIQTSQRDGEYREVPSKTFGSEGNSRKEMKKDVIATIKKMLADMKVS